eukprot:Hpha_TRINITY_DN15987_c1_g1::TRINITY_DN15987_c1_g1_i1::g.72258::m.72258
MVAGRRFAQCLAPRRGLQPRRFASFAPHTAGWSCPSQAGAVIRLTPEELELPGALAPAEDNEAVIVVSGALKSFDPKEWFEKLVRASPPVRYRHRLRPHASFSDYQWVELGTLVPVMLNDSSHSRSVCVLDERALRITGEDKALDSVLPSALKREACLFEKYFPVGLRPPGICLCLGGKGGGTPLHSDVYDWTGWNALFMGEKRWRFFRQDKETVEAFGVRRQGAAAGTTFSLGAGLHSDVDVYAESGDTPPQSATEPHSLSPPSSIAGGTPTPVAEVVQQAGEILIFPAAWLHQTYQYTATVAVACQLMTTRNAPQVLSHIVETSGVKTIDPSRFSNDLQEEELRGVINDTLSAALDVKYGEGRGAMILEYLRWAQDNVEEARRVAQTLPDHDDTALHPDLQQGLMVLRMIL